MPNIPKKAVIKGQKHALTYLTEEEMEILRKLTGKKHPRGPGGVPSFAEGDPGDSDGDPDGTDGEGDGGGFGDSGGDGGEGSSGFDGGGFGGGLGDVGISMGDVGEVDSGLGIGFGGQDLGDFGISMGDVGEAQSDLGVGLGSYDFSLPDYSFSTFEKAPPTIEGLWSGIKKTLFDNPVARGMKALITGRIPESYLPEEAISWSPEKVAKYRQDVLETGNYGRIARLAGLAMPGIGTVVGSALSALMQGQAMAERGWGELYGGNVDLSGATTGDADTKEQGALAALMQESMQGDDETKRFRQQALSGEYQRKAGYWLPKG